MVKFNGVMYSELKQNILMQAKAFLEDGDEFYPFATFVDMNNQLKPVGVYLERPEGEKGASVTIFEMLENKLKRGIVGGQYLRGAIGLDVYLPGRDPGLQIRIYDESNVFDCYFRYTKKNDQYFFEEINLS